MGSVYGRKKSAILQRSARLRQGGIICRGIFFYLSFFVVLIQILKNEFEKKQKKKPKKKN